ncbi:MAG TPA: GAF domain-containing protein [Steroidobacteraceae bacterium]|nr:GAF domain-containing protein [Steroidobacteraceae bacterium]
MTYTSQRYDFADKRAGYEQLATQLHGLLAGESDPIANAANTAALLFDALPEVSWAGFYFLRGGLRGGELVVGPFQGKPACVRIALGRGVCGTAAARRETLVVPDVNAFPGHISCDGASQSEVVVPLIAGDRLVGVLDLDSQRLARFDEIDARGLEKLAELFVRASRLEELR